MISYFMIESDQQPKKHEGQDAGDKSDHENDVCYAQQLIFPMQYLCLVVYVDDHVLIDVGGRVQQRFHLLDIVFSCQVPYIFKEK